MAATRQTKPRIDHAIVNVLIVRGAKFLLVEEGKPGREGLYNLPGGHVEAGETLFDAAIREAKEETGYDIKLTGLVGVYQAIYSYINVSGPVFSAEIISGKPTSSDKHPSLIWVTADELHVLAKEQRLYAKYPPFAIADYTTRGVFPLDVIASYNYLNEVD